MGMDLGILFGYMLDCQGIHCHFCSQLLEEKITQDPTLRIQNTGTVGVWVQKVFCPYLQLWNGSELDPLAKVQEEIQKEEELDERKLISYEF